MSDIQTSEVPAWHANSANEVLQRLASNEQGLTDTEAQHRLSLYGPNRLPVPMPPSALRRFIRQFENVLIYVLLVCAVITFFLGKYADSAVILGVVVINAIIGFIQEGKAEQALSNMRDLLAPQALVRRSGQQRQIDAAELVPGDIVLLAAGDRLPADVRLLQARDLRIEEALLTGEALAVEKNPNTVAAAALAERSNMAYSATLVRSGQALAVVVATGINTEVGKINQLLSSVESLTTPLLKQMEQFAQRLSVVIVVLALLTFVIGIGLHHYHAEEMFLAAVGLAVAAIPEGLPAILTIALAIGVQRMARRQAIVRRLPAVEALGSVTVICSDKTGTLTRNEMSVCSIHTAANTYQVEGAGYAPQGKIIAQRDHPPAEPVLCALARVALLCNDAEVRDAGEQGWRLEGEPTEGALFTLALKAGLDPVVERAAWSRLDVLPFSSENRYMATLHHHQGQRWLLVKGAPEAVLPRCSTQMNGTPEPQTLGDWSLPLQQYAKQVQRLLALAWRQLPAACELIQPQQLEQLCLLGVVGISDPPRAEAIQSVARCQQAGIRVKMITGDHALTAAAIAQQLGIGNGQAVSGHELDQQDDYQLQHTVCEVDVFARASPEHKLRLVRALQARGQVVAMTGDGVNDAPALKQANIGVAMGQKGTEVAKESAVIVLADDNFASIAHAVEEGRTVYDNLQKAILFILPTNAAQALAVILAIAFGLPALPITPLQILWVNLATAVGLSLALAFEPAEQDLMRRPPRDPKLGLLSSWALWRLGLVSVLLVSATFGLFSWALAQGESIEVARTIAVNTLMLGEIAYLFNTRYLLAPVLNRHGLGGNPYVLLSVALTVLIQLAYTYTTPLQWLFSSAALHINWWLAMGLCALGVLLAVELEKLWWRRRAG